MNGLEQMLAELESHRLVTVLVPLDPRKRGYDQFGMKRVNMDQSPKWYKKFCARHLSSRAIRRGKPDTRIRRANVLSSLNRMIAGKPTGKYGPELLKIAEQFEGDPF